jgi:hypothetical protein
MKIAVLLLTSLILLPLAFNFHPALAHDECVQGDIKIVAGWIIEPPLVNEINGIELTISKVSDEQPITNALAQLDTAIKKGAQTKSPDFQPQVMAGVYEAAILPTQTGQYAVAIKGTIAGQAFDCQIELQDVEDTALHAFPPSSTIPQEAIEQLQTVIADLAAQADDAKNAAEEAKNAADEATSTSAELKAAADRAYLFGIIGVGVGVAGIAIGVVALSRRERI